MFVCAHEIVRVEWTGIVETESVEDLFAAEAGFLLVEGQVDVWLRRERVDEGGIDFIVSAYGFEDGDLNDLGYVVASSLRDFCFLVFWCFVPDAVLNCRVGSVVGLPPFVELFLSYRGGCGIRGELWWSTISPRTASEQQEKQDLQRGMRKPAAQRRSNQR